jgi:hypothetical protein
VTTTDPDELRQQLDARTDDYQATLKEHQLARNALHEAVLAAWRGRIRPAEISERTGLAPGYLRKLAKAAGLPDAATGRRPGARAGSARAQAPASSTDA